MRPLLDDLPNFSDIQNLYLFNGAIANPNRIYLLAIEPAEDTVESQVKKSVFIYQRDAKPEEQLQELAKITKYVFAECEMSYLPTEHLVIYDSEGHKCAIKNKQMFDETDELNVGLLKSNLIGNKQYTATSPREVFYRNEQEQEIQLGAGQAYKDYETYDRPLDEDGEIDDIALITEDGFYDVDGFDEKHIYAVGGKGDVWRYVDGVWTQCEFPTNLGLENVCCAEDGLVYISGLEGMTYVGKEDSWKALKNPQLSIPFKDVRWYDGKVWATNDYGVWWISQEGVEEANVPTEVKICSGRLHVNAGMLLLVGMGGAALLEEGEWQILFNNMNAF